MVPAAEAKIKVINPEVITTKNVVKWILNTDWMENWYSESICLIDSGYSDYTSEKLRKILGGMTERQASDLRGWSNQSDEDREVRLAEFSSLF